MEVTRICDPMPGMQYTWFGAALAEDSGGYRRLVAGFHREAGFRVWGSIEPEVSLLLCLHTFTTMN